MVRYTGPAHTLEWPKDSGQLYQRGEEIPISKEEIEQMRGVGHSFAGADEPDEPQPYEPYEPATPAQDQPVQASSAQFTAAQQGEEAELAAQDTIEQTVNASTEGAHPARDGEPSTQGDVSPPSQTVHQPGDAQVAGEAVPSLYPVETEPPTADADVQPEADEQNATSTQGEVEPQSPKEGQTDSASVDDRVAEE